MVPGVLWESCLVEPFDRPAKRSVRQIARMSLTPIFCPALNRAVTHSVASEFYITENVNEGTELREKKSIDCL